MKKLNKKGFTIVELVIVIAVIAILAGVMIPTFGGIIEKANLSAVEQDAVNAYKAAYANDMADGKQDYKYNDETIELAAGLTYEEGNIVYADADKGITLKYDVAANTWAQVTAPAETTTTP